LKGSASFSEEKEAKRLLLIWAIGVANFRLKSSKKFFALLFFKKAAFFSNRA
jgi:hypothetical protein